MLAAAVLPLPLPQQRLLERGLTQREVTCVEHRHRRRTGKRLTLDELDATLLALDQLSLLPEQARHLLRSTPGVELRRMCQTRRGWCSYRKTLCSCASLCSSGEEVTQPRFPQVLAFDCEFQPERFAAVDEDGRILYDGLVVGDREDTTLRGVLSCDKPNLQRLDVSALQKELLALQSSGCTFIAHTPARDLEVLRLPYLPVVDIARCGLSRDAQTASLKHMAQMHLGLKIHAGGRAHCAVQDARVVMAIFQKLFSQDVPPSSSERRNVSEMAH
ncbi:hypothetical protein AB1Y20_006721 [Prymnesium parvum]|uniref:Exonuclease domain-containing protein n=1 Tax=Prymnesium parvum TaxID=97485 RepID=A0AB34J136_PRYPA